MKVLITVLLGILAIRLMWVIYCDICLCKESKAVEKAIREGKALRVYKDGEYLGEYVFVENEDITSKKDGADNG